MRPSVPRAKTSSRPAAQDAAAGTPSLPLGGPPIDSQAAAMPPGPQPPPQYLCDMRTSVPRGGTRSRSEDQDTAAGGPAGAGGLAAGGAPDRLPRGGSAAGS